MSEPRPVKGSEMSRRACSNHPGTHAFCVTKELSLPLLRAMADDHLFLSPEAETHRQVMSPNRPTVVMDGEVSGPSYGSMEVGSAPSVLANGVANVGRSNEASAGLEGQDLNTEGGGCGQPVLEAVERTTGSERETRRTGPDGARYAVGMGTSRSSDPLISIGISQQAQPQPTAQPPQTTPIPPQTPPRPQAVLNSSSHVAPAQQQQSPTAPPPGMQPEQIQAPRLQHQLQPSTLLTASPSPPPEQPNLSPPIQAVRSLTSQMASAAMAVGQRMQFHTGLAQGQFGPFGDYGDEGLYAGGYDGPCGSVGEPPLLPQHLRTPLPPEQSRPGVLAGLARAGQAFRRRVVEPVMQQVIRSPGQQASSAPPPRGDVVGQHASGHREGAVFTPEMTEAMREWTQRPSLLSPSGHEQVQGRDVISTSSISSELVREEVRRQVQLAMAEKNSEVKELKNQNEALKQAIEQQIRLQSSGGREHAQGFPERGQAGRVGFESTPMPAAQELRAGGVPDELHRLSQGAGISGGNPLSAGDHVSVPEGVLGGLPDRRVQHDRRSELGSKFLPADGSGPMHTGPSGNSGAVMDEPLQLLVQGMRQLQQAYIGKSDSKDVEFKGSIVIPEMPEVGAESSVAFADWLYELEQAVGGLSDKASLWFAACLGVARQAYTEYTVASPVARLTLQPKIPEELKDSKWARLERRVMTLLLASMKKPAKDDAVTHRILDVPSLLYRLHVLYQPGGVSERAAILKHLEGKAVGDNVHDCITALRKWRRYIERAESMRVSVPDPSILLGAVELIVKKVMESFPEVKFRTALMKNELQLQANPTLDGILRFHTHVLAELQMVAPAQTSSAATTLKAIEGAAAGTGEPLSPPRSPQRKDDSGNGKPPCKFFASKTGCTRGTRCKYSHVFDSKEDKKSRCWECGSTSHRRSECPTKLPKSPKKGEASGMSSAASTSFVQPPSLQQQAILESTQANQISSVVPGAPSTGSSALSQAPSALPTSSAAEAKDKEVKELLKEANAMLSKLAKLQALEVQTNESVGQLSVAMRAAGLSENEGSALLDSGASHAFRQARGEESVDSMPVRVELAGGQYVTLKQNKAGTLLATADNPEALNSTPILPLGALVQRLGCDLRWTRSGGLRITHPQFGTLRTFVKGNHPMLAETQALDLIAQLEDLHLRELEESTMATLVRSVDVNEAKDWDSLLDQYALTGQRDRLLAALLSKGSPLGDLPSNVTALTAVEVGLDDKSGWKYLKSLPFNRRTRKAMLCKRWSVRLFRRVGDSEVKVHESENVIHVDFDVARNRRFSLRGDSPAYKALMWAAVRGQLDGVIGAPPTQDAEELLSKQLVLWMVSRAASRLHGFLPPYLATGFSSTSSMWKSSMWNGFRTEFHVPVVQLEPPQTFESQVLASTLTLEGRLLREDLTDLSESSDRKASSAIWGPGICSALGDAINRWRAHPEEMYLGYLLHRLDAEGPWSDRDLRHWRQHVANGHVPFDKRCKACVTTAATGRAHRRVLAPSCYTLSLDVCGPFRKKGEFAGAKGYRYAMIGTYIMPKITGYKDLPIPEEPDLDPEVMFPEDDFLEEQGPPDPPLDQEDQAELQRSNEKFQALYKEVGDGMEYQTLHYAIPLRTRLMPEVEAAVKQLYLQIRAEGLPVTRVHSDRARELRGKGLRSWLLHRDILPTTGEAQVPQTNGRAEAGVKRAKVRTKTLLKASGLDTCCWPFAMSYAAFQQREYALGRARHVVPFGSPVLVKNKVFGVGNKFDLDDRWQGGIYVGPSPELRHGHMVRFPSGRVVTSLHVRSNVVDSDELTPLEPVEASFPMPSRRISGKRALAPHETRADPPESPEVPLDHEDPSGHDLGHTEAAGVWTDDEAILDSVFGGGGPQLMMYQVSLDHPESAEVPLDHEDPSGRFWSKASASIRALKPLSEPERCAEELAESYLKAGIMGTTLVLQLFEKLEEVRQLFSRASRRKPQGQATSWATGAFTHGGVSGLRNGARRLPNVTRFLAKFAKEFMGAQQFATVVIQRNGGGRAHRDFHNYLGAKNWLCPLTSFKGGGLWVQLDNGEVPVDNDGVMTKEVKPGLNLEGKIIEAKKGKTFSFDPMRWHEVQAHSGERVMVIAFTPRLSNLDAAELDYLRALGFLPFPEEEGALEQVDEAKESLHGHPKEEKVTEENVSSLFTLNEAHQQVLEDLQERSQSLRLLLEEERLLAEDLRQAGKLVEEETEKTQLCITQMLQQATQLLSKEDRARLKVCLRAASEANEPDYEQLLEFLEGDLQVVHTVPLTQVRPVVDRWHSAIRKELDNLIKGGTLEEISCEEARRLERQGALRLVPSKSVFTLKPPGPGDKKYKRKYRLVLCGNFAAPEEQFGSLYAGGATAETLRTVLVVAAKKKWLGATADITGAFLLAPWPEHLHLYAVVPPRILMDNGYIASNAYWLVRRPLYGLRESPAIWATYRSSRFSQARVLYNSKYLVLRVSKVDPELWFVFFENEEELLGCIITYVDDLFYVSESEIVVALHAWVIAEWPCSALEWASAPGGTRYLGMEIFQRASKAFEVHQRGYILDLLRAHGMQDSPATQLPCPKEWVVDDIIEDPESFSEEELRFGQRVVGEQLWLTMRTRPDLQFVVQHMAQWVSKHPNRVARVARRVLSYLIATLDLKLVLGASDSSTASTSITSGSAAGSSDKLSTKGMVPEGILIGYSDSSFAPYGSRSYGASVVAVFGSPVAWKSGRQSMVTLSTMESELLEATNAVTLLESVGCLVDEIFQIRVPRQLRVDNSAATSMLQGSAGSWRTRHLRVRCAFVREQVQRGLLEVAHVEGMYQLADLSTKMHPRARLLDLLRQWGFEGLPSEAVQLHAIQAILMSCLVFVLEQGPRAEAAGPSGTNAETLKEPLRVAGFDELMLVACAVAVAAILVWEIFKTLFRCCVRGYRKQSKLSRLRELARLTAELEIDRLQSEQEAVSGATVRDTVQEVLTGPVVQSALESEPRRSAEPPLAEQSMREREEAVTPRVMQGAPMRQSPGASSVASSLDDDPTNANDRWRLCKDVLGLMTCESLKRGLRTEGLTVSGLKGDQVARLALRLGPDPNFIVLGRKLPSDRQLRYILWLWRHRHLQGRCQLEWADVFTRENASRWIHQWKEA